MANMLACEGVAHLDALPYSVPGPIVRYLPAPLIRARAEALNPRNCLDLSRTSRMALYGILAFFDIRKPGEAVFASREKLCAEALLGSQPTLYRALADLVTRGYIRREQGRRLGKETYGQYSVSRIWLEEKALRLLGLLDGKAAAKNAPNQDKGLSVDNVPKEEGAGPAKAAFPQGPSITVTDRLQDSELSPSPQLYSKEQPPRSQLSQAGKGWAGESLEKRIDSKTRLPAELVRLMTLGLSKARICGLMKQAREHGNGGKLGAIVALTWCRLQKLTKPQEVFAYLSKLVKQKKDYNRLVEIQGQYEDKDRMPKAVLERLKAKMQVFLARAKGMLLVTRSGRALGIVQVSRDSAYVDLIDDKGTRRTMTINAKVIEMWEEGDYVLRTPGLVVESEDDFDKN